MIFSLCYNLFNKNMLEVQTSQQENKETLFPINMYLLPGENIKDGAR
jgi:hypothetical protein